jgi:hypothetical protein
VLGDDISPGGPKEVAEDEGPTTASSRGPRTGMNSGMRSMGEATHEAPKISSILDLLGTRGSRTRPLNSLRRFGNSVATSRPAVRRPPRYKAATATM